QVFTRGDERLDVRATLRGDDRARLHGGKTRRAGADVDVAVAGQQAELLEARARVAADALRVVAVDHQQDLDLLLLRVLRQLDVADGADGDAGHAHRVALR